VDNFNLFFPEVSPPFGGLTSVFPSRTTLGGDLLQNHYMSATESGD